MLSAFEIFMGFALCGLQSKHYDVSCLFRVTIYIEIHNLILKFAESHIGQSQNGSDNMLTAKAVPIGAFVFMSSMDWFTTTIGILYFGAVEANPFFANLTVTGLPAFTVLKLSITIFVGLLFHQTEKILMKTQVEQSKAFVRTRHLLRGAYMAVVVFLLVTILNNIIVIVRTI